MLKLVTVFLGGLHTIPGADAEFFFGSSPREARLCLGRCHAETYDSFSWLCARHPWRGC